MFLKMFLLFSLFLLLSSSSSPSSSSSSFSSSSSLSVSDSSITSSNLFIEDVLRSISAHKGWNFEDIRVSDVDLRNARVGLSQRYEFRLRIGKNSLLFRFSDETSFSKRLKAKGGIFGLGSILKSASRPDIKGLSLEGPLELRVFGDDEISLSLPHNSTFTGLKRVLLSEGISVELKGAHEIVLRHPTNYGLPLNRSSASHYARRYYMPFGPSACFPLLEVHISGSALVMAYRTYNLFAQIQTTFVSEDAIKLLPDKCYNEHYSKNQPCLTHSLSSRLGLVENLLRSFLGDRILQNHVTGLLKAKITASTVIRFQLVLERNLGSNDTAMWAAWRTKPRTERLWFDIMARVDADKLKPIMLKKATPFIALDTMAWSNLMSNVSFTQFPPLLVPPEALTLDVKW